MVSCSSLNKKKTLGRRKMELKKIQNPNQLQSSLSKRKSTLFHKSAELCCLTGAQIAVLVTTPADKVFAFGHPSVDSVINRYLTETEESAADFALSDFSLEAEKRRIDRICVENMEIDELENYVLALENLRNNVLIRADEVKMMNMECFNGVDELERIVNDYFSSIGDDFSVFGNGDELLL